MAERTRRGAAFGVGTVLSRSFPIWIRNLVPFTILSLVVYSPLIIYAFVTFAGGEVTKEAESRYDLVSTLAGRVLDLIVTGAVVYGVFQQVRGQPAGLGDCLRVGFSRLLPVLGIGIIVAVLVTLGLLALVIPGILLQLMWWVAVPVAVVERLGVVGSMQRSAKLTSGEKGTIFLILLVLGLIQFAVIFGIAFVAAMVLPEAGAAQALVTLLIAIPFGALTAVANAVGYHDLRVAKEGVGIDDLIKVFE